MGLLDKIFRPDKAKESAEVLKNAHAFFTTLTGYKPAFTSWKGEIYEAMIVRAAIDARARHASKLKFETFGTANKPLQSKLKLAPNEWQTWSQFLYRVSSILDVYNNAVIVPVFDEFMTITGYFPVLPKKCSVIEYKGEAWLRYEFSNGQRGAVEFKKCAILTKHQLKNDFFGETNEPLEETMQLLHIQNQGIENAVKNTSTYKFYGQLTNFAKPEDLANERKRFTKENLSSESEADGFLLFPNNYKDIHQIDSKPYTVDADQMKLIYSNVYHYFGVNEKILENSVTGDEWAAFYEGAIEPFSIQLSEVMTKAVFSEKERVMGSGVMLTSNRLQYLSAKDKLEISNSFGDRAIMNRDEIRDIWNLPPLPNGEGKKYTIRGEYYLIDEEGNITSKEGANAN